MSKNTEINLSFGRTDTARLGRIKQLERWNKSDVAKESGTELKHRKSRKIKFQDNVVFHSAVISGDTDEVERLLKDGYDVNCINDDGLTGLHHSCIEEDWDMVQLLVDHGANVNATDFEGWTPLHAAASCGYEDICRLLLNHGADPSIVNNEGSTAVEQALEQEDEVIATMIQKEIEKQGISIEEVKSREHHLVMQEALELKGNPTLDWSLSTQGATPLHVAAAKGYLDVMEILLKARKAMLDCTDKDGWTPLHAAVYWGEFPAAEVLVINGADFSAVTLLGKSVDDLVNEDDAEQFEELKKFAGSAQQGLSNKQQRSLRTSSSGDVKPSPQAVRRRLSKELSRESLKMDMYNEKRTLENAPNNIAEETEPSTSPSLVPEGKEIIEQLIEGSENAKEKEREKEKKGKLEENSVKPSSTAKEGEEQEVKVSQPSRVKDSQAAMESERETKKTDSNRNGEAAAPVEKQSQEKSPPDDTETGMFRPRSQGVGSLGRKVSGSVHSMIRQLETKIETEGSVVPRPKSESFSGNLPAGAVGRTGSGGEVKRFPFQPKTIPNKTSPIAARKTSVTSSGTSPSTMHKYDQKGTITVHSTAQPTKTDTKRGTPSLPLKTENKISITTKASASASASTKMGNNVSSPPQTSPAGSPTSSPKGELVRRLSARNKISSTLDNLMKGQRRVSLSSTSSEAGTDKDSTKSHSRTGSVEVDTVFKESDSTKMHTNTKVPTSNQNGATAVLPTDEPTLPPSTHNTDCVDMSRSSSMSSNLSTPSNDYSVSRASSRDESQKSEMARKRVARRERKERKATQGVSQEDFKLLMQGSDEDLTKSKLEDSTGESPLMSRRDTDLDTTYEGDSSLFQTPPPTSSTKIQPETLDSSSQLKPSEESSTTLFESSPEKSTSGKNYVMSAFKPRDRPQPKKILDSPHLGQSGVLWSTPEMERRKQVKTDGEPSSRDTPTIVKEERREEDDEKTLDKKQSAQVKVEPKDEDSQFLSPNERSRAKSVARRKKKEKRRSTGIKFSDEDESISEEDLPEELKKIVAKGKKKKSEKTKSDAQKSNGKEEKKDVVGATKVEEGQVRRDAEQEEELRKLQERLRELEDVRMCEVILEFVCRVSSGVG
jgi:ankyrin repeat protein